jgi:hypothetical protein
MASYIGNCHLMDARKPLSVARLPGIKDLVAYKMYKNANVLQVIIYTNIYSGILLVDRVPDLRNDTGAGMYAVATYNGISS